MGNRNRRVSLFEIKLRRKGDRVNSNGKKVEGGKIFSRHFEANNIEHAERRAKKIKNTTIISIRKVHAGDIMGRHENWGLERILGMPIARKAGEINESTTLDEMIFGKQARI